MRKQKLAIFHYHLNPGGVTSVILLGLRSLLTEGGIREIEEIALISGGEEAREKPFREALIQLEPLAQERGIRLFHQSLPEIGYASAMEEPPGDEEAALALAEKLATLFPRHIWWIHNHHLGKNPRFTRALLHTAQTRPEQVLFFQIHDFPENGRLTSWRHLKERTPQNLYPGGPGVYYLTINERDRKILTAAGLPEERVFHLPNPVDPQAPPPSPGKEKIKPLFEKRFGPEFPGYLRGRPWAIYPVRTIRRKNVLEAALGARLFPGGINLLTTLPGHSDQEKDYSGLTEELYREGTIPGLWGTGTWRDPESPGFEEFTQAGDLVFSTSLQEGFGYFYIDAFRWGKPLFSRKLDVLEELLPHLPGPRIRLYDRLWVPPEKEWVRRWESHWKRQRQEMDKLLGEWNPLSSENSPFFSPLGFDFSALPPDDQAALLRRAANDSAFLGDIAERNTAFIKGAGEILEQSRESGGPEDLEKIREQWGMGAFRRRTAVIIRTALEGPSPPCSEGREQAVLAAFVNTEGLKPLFTPYRRTAE